jgi:hypothetical protein
MADKTAGPLIPAAVILGGLILLPVALIILGFDLVPLMAITAWSRTAWLTALAALAVVVVAAAAFTRARNRV